MTKLWEILNVPGSVLMAIFTMCMIAMSLHAYVYGLDIPAGVQTIYMFVMGLYGSTKTANRFISKKEASTEQK